MSQPRQFKNLVDLCSKSCERYGGNPLFGTRRSDGSWDYISYAQFGALVDEARGGFRSLGLGDGEVVAVISNNRVEWAVGAYATYGCGGMYVPMYEKQNLADWEYIIGDSGAKLLLVANPDIAARAMPLLDRFERLEKIICLSGEAEGCIPWDQVMAMGRDNPAEPAQPEPSALAGLIYTSGTTGNPKGVQLSHGNITSNVNAVQSLFPMEQQDRSLSFLPWAHSFGQTCELHSGISFGISMAICDDVTRLIEYLPDVQPTLLFSVPRIFNRIYDGLNKKMADAPAARRGLFEAAMRTARRRRELTARGESSTWLNVKHALFDRLVFSKVRDRLGGRLRCAFSGGAAISREVAEFIDDIGVLVYEGYGLSETSPIATMNYPGNKKIGTVGRPIPEVDIIIDTDAVGGAMGQEGEILIKGPNVMQGYHNLPEQTADVLRDDGAFRSGDLGWLGEDGFLRITGRIKEQYKLENGKYVVPSPLEEQLKLSGFINQVMVFGDNKLHNVAIVVPDVDALQHWAKGQGVSGDLDSLLAQPAVKKLYEGELERYSSEVFKGFEKVRDFRFVSEEFSTDNDMLTPTLKLKRRNVIKAYQSLLDEMYEG
ncbi:MAG: long-chain fatty acid--CoA ligase [Rickettsiales bacterium]|nr:long-chain fatty acid--CoA ligase [Rickettsiales bacterium]